MFSRNVGYLECLETPLKTHSSYVDKFGHAWISLIMVIRSKQSNAKFWQVEWRSIYSPSPMSELPILNAKLTPRRLILHVPNNWICPEMSFQTNPHPLNREVRFHDPSTKHIFSKHMTCESVLLNGCDVIGIVSFAENQSFTFVWSVLGNPRLSFLIVYRSELFKNTKLPNHMGSYLALGPQYCSFSEKIVHIGINTWY